MYGIVQVGGHQYKVFAGDIFDVERLECEDGKSIDLNEVLFISGNETIVGAPTIAGASVTVKVIRHDRSKKLRWMKRNPGKYRKTKGHRQPYTCLLVTEIKDGKGNSVQIDPNSKNAQKYLK